MSKNKSDKKQNVSSDSNNEEGINDDEFDLSMDENERERFNQMSEKEREIEIFKRLEQRELMKTREQIKRKLELAAGNKQSNTAKRKRIPSHETDEDDSDYEVGKNGDKKSSDEEGELHDDDKDDTSSDDDNVISSKPSSSTEKRRQKLLTKTPINTENVEQDDEDTAYHKPSELVNKYNKKMAMADLINKRRDKKQAEEKRKKENQKAALDLDEIFGKEDGKSSSSSSSPASSRSSSPVYGKSRSPSPVSQPIEKLDDLLKCQAIRRRLARIVHAPFFNKTIVGCFVRVQIGSHDGKPTYRIAQVVDVVETAKIYEVEPNTDIRTNKGLKLKICNNDAQRVIRLEFVSNSNFTETEYSFWLNRMKETESPLPTIDFVKKKQKEMIDALNYKYTDSEINLMVREKQRFKRQPTNFAFQKSELLKQKEDAEQNGDKERVRDLQHQINDLEEKAKKIESQRTKNLSAITAINQRNRDHMKQFLSAEHMQNNEHFQVRDDDPFTRKSARMKLVTGVTRVKSDAESLDISNGSVSLDSTLNLSGKPSILKNSSSVLPPPGDLFSAHGIDINIDLDKVLPATTTISLRAPPSASTSTSSLNQQRIPQKSSRTLTLEEYKRKYSSRMT